MRKWFLLAQLGVCLSALAAAPVLTNLNPATKPGGRTGPTAASNRQTPETTYLFGGNALSFNNQLWAFDHASNNWSQPADTNSPSARSWSQVSWDLSQQRLILFGGSEALGGPLKNDVWSYNPTTLAWTQLTVTGAAPSPRFAHSMVYVPHLSKHLLFGGGTASDGSANTTTVDAQLWLLTVNASASSASWQQLTPTGTVPGRGSSCVGYDPVRRRLIAFGGEVPGATVGDTLQYDVAANTWTTDAPTGDVPSARASVICAFDERTGKLLIYGGVTTPNGTPVNTTFSYDPVRQIWKRLTPAANPGNLTFGADSYSVTAGGMFFFGGRVAFLTHSNATWTLRANADPVVVATGGGSVTEGALVNMSAAGSSDADGDPLTYSWVQSSGPAITLTGANTATPSFTAPQVSANTPVSFTVTVSDGEDPRTATINITVLDSVPSQLVFTSPPRTMGAGACSGLDDVITVELRDASNRPIPAGPGGQAFTANSTAADTTTWYADASCTTPVPDGTFVLPEGETSANLFLRDTHVGTPLVSLTNDVGLRNPAAQMITLTAFEVPEGPLSLVQLPLLQGRCSEQLSATGEALPVVQGEGPYLFSVEPMPGAVLPAGLQINANTGQLEWQPTVKNRGEHHFMLRVSSALGTDVKEVWVSVECGPMKQLTVGCESAAGAPLLGLAWLSLAGVAFRRFKRAQATSGR